MLDIKTLETWLWNAACSIRGAVDAPKFKDYILPLVFVKRLSDVFEDEIKRLSEEFGDGKTALEIISKDHSLVRFFIPKQAVWSEIRKQTTKIGEKLTDAICAIAKENPKLQGVVNIVDFNATVSGQRIIDDGKLSNLIEIISSHRLGLKDAEPDILGRAYEYLLRKFAEGQGQSAGEFYTPKEVGWIMAYILDPEQGQEVYDPACGSGGLLVKSQLALEE
ncbi:MAG TPA: SAM-dependent DNA methyltransferase, partial [Candidatus Atribacteria bacterium]|nr:SAM-dependent DNA methyltransferase [Candidatus Atribacteria bacterium]